ncbi:MAG: hypothetical protein NTY23_00395 [Chloroflexi bacterium]|nr:hypothetical protein [Chloroflexota bacterium]
MPTRVTTNLAQPDTARLHVTPLGRQALRLTTISVSNSFTTGRRPWVDEVLPGLAAAAGIESELSAWATARGAQVNGPGGELLLTIHELRETACGTTRLVISSEPGERFYGWGERFDRFARGRGVVRLHARESPAFTQQHQSYSAIPFIVSSRGYALLLLNSHASIWRLRPARGRVEVLAAGPGAREYPGWARVRRAFTPRVAALCR